MSARVPPANALPPSRVPTPRATGCFHHGQAVGAEPQTHLVSLTTHCSFTRKMGSLVEALLSYLWNNSALREKKNSGSKGHGASPNVR